MACFPGFFDMKRTEEDPQFHNLEIFGKIYRGTSVFAAIFLIWPTVQGHLHHTRNVHTDLEFDCPTAKTGLLGGGAFASLNSSLFWLVSLMLATNAREDYFADKEKNELI